jgi:hypothetical protein
MLDTINPNDPLSTAAAALQGAEDLVPLVRHRLPVLLPSQRAKDCARLAGMLDDQALFEQSTIAALRELLGTIKDAIEDRTDERQVWVPVRCIDGDEEFEPVTVRERDLRARALAAIAAELGPVIELAARTVALPRAAAILRRSQ